LAGEEASDMLDLLFRASHASGASVENLAADTAKYAGVLLTMGFSLEESVALFAMLEREGVRVRTTFSALEAGIAKLTRDGTVPAREALSDLFVELQELDREAALAKGIEIFGNSAGELIDAVRDGRLSVEEFTQRLVEGEDTIIGVAKETDGWREALAKVKNFLKLQFEDVAREVFRNVTEFVDSLVPAAERVSKAFDEDGLQGALKQVAEEWDRIYNERIKPLFDRFLIFLDEVVKPLAIAIAKEIGSAMWSGVREAFVAGMRRGLFGSGDAKSMLSDAERQTLDALRTRTPQADILNMGSLGSPGPMPQVPALPPRPSTSVNPAGSGGTGRPAAGGSRMIEYAPGMFAAVPMAAGGIVTSPTLALVGEAGPEAVIPLNRAGQLGATYVINVTGALDAEGTARTILRVLRDAERRTGERLTA
jgi:hypothetical protein